MSHAAERAKRALLAGDVAGMASLLEDHPALLSASAWEGGGLVALAVEVLTTGASIPLVGGTREQEAVLELLLERGADPNQADSRGWTALHAACMSGHLELTRTLLDRGASPRSVADGIEGATPIAWAMFYAHRETAELVASHELVPGGLRSSAALGRSASEWLDESGDRRLGATRDRSFYRPLGLFPECEVRWDRQTTPDEALTWAARNGRIEAMAELVGLGADLDSNPYRGTALL